MSLDPIKIPQNVYIEDRIVGPLTLRQVIMVALGGGFSYVLWASLSRAYGNLPLPIMVMVWIPAVLSVAFAFVRINDLSLLRILLLLIEQMEKPMKRVWTPRQGITVNFRTFASTEPRKHSVLQKSAAPIEQLTKTLDATPISPLPASTEAQSEPQSDVTLSLTKGDHDLSAPSSELRTGSTPQNGAKAEPAPTWRRPVDPQKIQAEPLRSTKTDIPDTPRNTIFRDLSGPLRTDLSPA